MIEKDVEKLLRGGVNTAVLTMRAEVCQRYGARLYSLQAIEYFNQIRRKLEAQEADEFVPLGRSFQVLDIG